MIAHSSSLTNGLLMPALYHTAKGSVRRTKQAGSLNPRKTPDRVTVELRPFNDRRLTRDLAVLCQRVEAAQLRLPDGRRMVLRVASSCRSTVSG